MRLAVTFVKVLYSILYLVSIMILCDSTKVKAIKMVQKEFGFGIAIHSLKIS